MRSTLSPKLAWSPTLKIWKSKLCARSDKRVCWETREGHLHMVLGHRCRWRWRWRLPDDVEHSEHPISKEGLKKKLIHNALTPRTDGMYSLNHKALPGRKQEQLNQIGPYEIYVWLVCSVGCILLHLFDDFIFMVSLLLHTFLHMYLLGIDSTDWSAHGSQLLGLFIDQCRRKNI